MGLGIPGVLSADATSQRATDNPAWHGHKGHTPRTETN